MKLINFIKEARIELKKVNWPSRQQTTNYTLVVILISVVVAIFLGGLDYIFRTLLTKYII